MSIIIIVGFHGKYVFKDQDRVVQTLIKCKCQLKLNWHLKLLEIYMKLINLHLRFNWDLNLIEACATQSRHRTFMQSFSSLGKVVYNKYKFRSEKSLPPVVCRRAHVLFTLLVFVWFVFTSSCL